MRDKIHTILEYKLDYVGKLLSQVKTSSSDRIVKSMGAYNEEVESEELPPGAESIVEEVAVKIQEFAEKIQPKIKTSREEDIYKNFISWTKDKLAPYVEKRKESTGVQFNNKAFSKAVKNRVKSLVSPEIFSFLFRPAAATEELQFDQPGQETSEENVSDFSDVGAMDGLSLASLQLLIKIGTDSEVRKLSAGGGEDLQKIFSGVVLPKEPFGKEAVSLDSITKEKFSSPGGIGDALWSIIGKPDNAVVKNGADVVTQLYSNKKSSAYGKVEEITKRIEDGLFNYYTQLVKNLELHLNQNYAQMNLTTNDFKSLLEGQVQSAFNNPVVQSLSRNFKTDYVSRAYANDKRMDDLKPIYKSAVKALIAVVFRTGINQAKSRLAESSKAKAASMIVPVILDLYYQKFAYVAEGLEGTHDLSEVVFALTGESIGTPFNALVSKFVESSTSNKKQARVLAEKVSPVVASDPYMFNKFSEEYDFNFGNDVIPSQSSFSDNIRKAFTEDEFLNEESYQVLQNGVKTSVEKHEENVDPEKEESLMLIEDAAPVVATEVAACVRNLFSEVSLEDQRRIASSPESLEKVMNYLEGEVQNIDSRFSLTGESEQKFYLLYDPNKGFYVKDKSDIDKSEVENIQSEAPQRGIPQDQGDEAPYGQLGEEPLPTPGDSDLTAGDDEDSSEFDSVLGG